MASTRATLSQNNYWQYRSSNRAALGPVSEWRAGLAIRLRLYCCFSVPAKAASAPVNSYTERHVGGEALKNAGMPLF